MYNFNKENLIKIFYEVVESGKIGGFFDEEGATYVKFDYFENGKLYNQKLDEIYYGNDRTDENHLYEYEDSNGTANYFPSLIVKDKELFFDKLWNCICQYSKLYDFSKIINNMGEDKLIRAMILIIFSNARYVDYLYPEQYLDKLISFINDKTFFDIKNKIIVDNLGVVDNSNIVINNELDIIGYETPYRFEIYLEKNNEKFYLPVINYAIKDNICYIYSIQNKIVNKNELYQKKIKRLLYKINEGLEYNNDKNIPAPSFILSLSIFMNVLNSKNINDIRGITFLPDRYFEKEACGNEEVQRIQTNLTEKLINLFYIQKQIYPNIDINYPLYDNVTNEDYGDDIVLNIIDLNLCNNNFINNIFEKKLNKQKLL